MGKNGNKDQVIAASQWEVEYMGLSIMEIKIYDLRVWKPFKAFIGDTKREQT